MTGRHRSIRGGRARTAPTLIVSATAAASLVNYSYSLVLLWLVSPRQYTVIASVTALMLVFGNVASASTPWVLAREVAVSAADQPRRRTAMIFSGWSTFSQAVVAVLICAGIVSRYAAWPTITAACIAAMVIFFSTTSIGYLQGIERFGLISLLRVGEVLMKITAGVTLVALGLGAWGAVSGFTFGALLVVFACARYMREDAVQAWRLRRQAGFRPVIFNRRLWTAAGGITGIQAGTAIIAGLDTIIASVMLAGKHQLATYQVALILGRIPFYLSSSLAIIVFPRMVRASSDQRQVVTRSLHAWVRLAGPAAFIVATVPLPILDDVLPARYGAIFALLPWAALAGFALGGINLVTTYWQASGRWKGAALVLLATCLLGGLCDVRSLAGGSVLHLAWSSAATSLLGLAVLLVLVQLGWRHSLRGLGREAAIVLAPGLLLVYLKGHPLMWAAAAVLGLGLPALRGLHSFGSTLVTTRRRRVLHLAFEDPRRPGSGGGSIRTMEIDRRLTASFDVTVVCARYRGSRPRQQDGVRYVHIGLPWGERLSLLSYFLCLPWALLRYSSDLVVEDFAAPFSSVAVPWLTGRPVIGVVQWLFARQKASEYGLPFHLVEQIGLASHRRLVAVSEDLGAELARRNPRAEVSVIQNGLPDEAFLYRDRPRRDILFLGRLELAQKGIDLLLRSYSAIACHTNRRLIIAGSGPDEARIREMADDLGVGGRVELIGRVAPAERFDLLASAELVAMPSRYETFGMVAAEALAVGTPVVAFDIPCLRAVLTPDHNVIVPPFDVEAFSAAMMRVLNDTELRERLGRWGKMRVDELRWDELAKVQESVYAQVFSGIGQEVVT